MVNPFLLNELLHHTQSRGDLCFQLLARQIIKNKMQKLIVITNGMERLEIPKAFIIFHSRLEHCPCRLNHQVSLVGEHI